MERLSLPRRNYQASESDSSVCRPELPKNPLPTWVTLSLDSKLPMIPGPRKNVLLYTTNLGEKRHKSTRELDFDLTDPYSQTMSNDYKALHDPHLKPHLDTDHMRKRLRQGGFITREGKVVCTLREYNEYRQYLRRINLALDRRRQTKQGHSKRRSRVTKGEDVEGSHEWRVKQIRQRLQQQRERERARYQRLVAEEEERRERVRESQKSRMSEKEQLLRQEQERRQDAIRKRQEEERAKKMEVLNRWYEEDEARRSVGERRRKERELARERKLAESWEERRRVQQRTLAEELRLRRLADDMKKARLAQRERLMQQRRHRQQAIFEKMTQRQREEREKLEAECAQRIAERMERRKARAKNKKRKTTHKEKKTRQVLKSNWDMTQILIQQFSEGEGAERSASAPPRKDKLPDTVRKVMSDLGIQEVSPKAKVAGDEQLLSYTRLADFKGAIFADNLNKKEFLTDSGIPTAGRLTMNITKLVEKIQSRPIQAEDLALVLVSVNNYIASQVITPACMKYEEESRLQAVKNQRSIRFSTQIDEHIIYSADEDESFSEDEREDELLDIEDDDLETPSSRLVLAVDSLTRLKRKPSEDRGILGSLANILCRLLEKLERGEISAEDAARLAAAANDIIGESPLIADRSDTSLSSQSSTTSAIAAEMVKTTMEKLQHELLMQYTVDELNEFYGMPPLEVRSSELTGMSKFVAETALAMAVESLMSCTDGIITDQMLGKDSGREGDYPTGKSDSTESMSCTSEFILKILTRVLDQVRSQEATSRLTDWSRQATFSSGPHSETSFYIQELLTKAVSSVQATMATQPLELIKKSAKSDTSFFIMDTLQRVVQEIQKSRAPSPTSFFIDNLISRIATETTASEPNLSWQESYDCHQRRSSASVTSIFIRDTLSKVLKDIEDEFQPGVPKEHSATSIFAQEIVQSTLKKCASAVCQEMLPDKKLSELTAAILNSQQCNEDRNKRLSGSSLIMKPTCTQSLGEFRSVPEGASEVLAEKLIRTTLEKAQRSLDHGTISAEQVVNDLSNISASSGLIAALDIDGQAIPASTCTSEQAYSYVSAAIEKAIEEVSACYESPSPGRISWDDKGPSVAEVGTFIQSILTNAIRELRNGLMDESTIEELEANMRNSLEALNQETEEENLPGPAGSGENVSYVNRNFLMRPESPVDESDTEEEEVILQPVYKGKPLHVDKDVARKALGAISVKNLEEMDDPAQALPRNSFRSLICPEVSDIQGLDTSSQTSTRSQLERASQGTLPSQTRLRLAAASKCSQPTNKLDAHTEEATEDKKVLKTRSLQAVNKSPSRKGSDTSPYNSPGSSPKPSRTTVNRASLVAASAPSVRNAASPTKLNSSARLSRIPSNEKDPTTRGSKKSLTGKSSPQSIPSPGPSSETNVTPKKSSGTRVLSESKSPSSSSLKKRTSPVKLKSPSGHSRTSIEKRRSSENAKRRSSTDNACKESDDTTTRITETKSETEITQAATQVESVPEKDPPVEESSEIQEEINVSERKISQHLPRESGPIEMTTSANPPTRRRSSDSHQPQPSKNSITSLPDTQRSGNLGPRPSSGFHKSKSGNLGKGSRHAETRSNVSLTGSHTSSPSVDLVKAQSEEGLRDQRSDTLKGSTSKTST